MPMFSSCATELRTFTIFIEVLKDRANLPCLKDSNLFDASVVEVEPGITSADYLSGFLLGTRRLCTIVVVKVSYYR
jgi:hypothetical protein